MHEPIANNIEAYLTRSDSTRLPAEFTAHLVACGGCREELAVMERHSRVIRVLRPGADAEPSPGFYARVMERIDAQRPLSMWTIFLQPFGQRIAFAFARPGDSHGRLPVHHRAGGSHAGPAVAIQQTTPDEILPGEDQPGIVLGHNTDQDRGTVLVNLATYQEQ